MARNAADQCFVIDGFPAHWVEPHLCHPTFELAAGVLLLPVETLATPHRTGHVAAVRHIDHSHQTRGSAVISLLSQAGTAAGLPILRFLISPNSVNSPLEMMQSTHRG